jgi:L-fuculose-phosphate aldolase
VQLAAEREAVVRLAQRLRPDGLVVGTAGNLSARAGDLVAITPSGVDYDRLEPELVCVVDLEGAVVEGELAPSTELPLHLAVHTRAPAGAVVHTHSPAATTVACVEDELPAIHYLIAQLGGPVRVAPYATFGTRALARSVAEGLAGRQAVLLASHGTITVGDTLDAAYANAVLLEWLAALYVRARALGPPRELGEAELAEVARRLEGYGAPAPRGATSPES